MRKLSLDLNALAVESFETAKEPVAAGTVRGNDDSGVLGAQFSCDPDACGGGGDSAETACGPCGTGATHCQQHTCAATCPYTCDVNAATCFYHCSDVC